MTARNTTPAPMCKFWHGTGPTAALTRARCCRRSLRYGCRGGYRPCDQAAPSCVTLVVLLHRRCWNSGTGQAGADDTGDKSDRGHAGKRSGTQRVTRHLQSPTWQDPAEQRGRYLQAHTYRHATGTALRFGQVALSSPGTSAASCWRGCPAPASLSATRSSQDPAASEVMIESITRLTKKVWLMMPAA